ncbi:MAG: transcription-repair coupling factor (superfamily II helicase), partial [Litorivivens sp.]
MTISDLRAIYEEDHRISSATEKLRANGSKVHLKGLIGSSGSIAIGAIAEKLSGTHLVILNDKEEAAYL